MSERSVITTSFDRFTFTNVRNHKVENKQKKCSYCTHPEENILLMTDCKEPIAERCFLCGSYAQKLFTDCDCNSYRPLDVLY